MRRIMIASIVLLAGLMDAGPARAGAEHSHASQSLEDAARYQATEGTRAREIAARRVGWRDETRPGSSGAHQAAGHQ